MGILALVGVGGHFAVADQLLEARADAEARGSDDIAMDAVAGSLGGNRSRFLSKWLARYPHWDVRNKVYAITQTPALELACLGPPCCSVLARKLLVYRADPHSCSSALGSFMSISAQIKPDSDTDAIFLAMTLRLDASRQMRPALSSPFRLLLYPIMRVAYRCGSTNGFVFNAVLWEGASALHAAGYNGSTHVVNAGILLDARADPTLRNVIGLTALECAPHPR